MQASNILTTSSFIHNLVKLLNSRALAVLVTLAALVLGVPLFLRMPPWCDFTLYDVMARTTLHGGMLFCDVFDTNLPGFVWCLIGLRHIDGSLEFVRAVDLAIVALITAVLVSYVPRGRYWLLAAVALWYPFTTEFTHMQRDIWLTLPLLLAVKLHVDGLARTVLLARSASESEIQTRLRFGLTKQGALWAVAVWFKPHMLLVAAVFWLATMIYQPRSQRLRDFKYQFLGGSVVALAGILALVLTGTWPHLMDVLFKWNARYLHTVWSECGNTLSRFLNVFPPWSLLHAVGLPLAMFQVVMMFRRREPERLKVGALSVLYLTLVAQSIFLQRNFDYVQAPAMFVLFALLSMTIPRLFALYVLAVPLLAWLQPFGFQPPLGYRERLALWSECFRELPTKEYRARQHALRIMPQYCSAIDPVQIGEVADWLRSQNAVSGEVLAWHDAPHAVYLELGHAPPFRFMHITTTLISDDNFWRATRELKKAYPHIRYIVSDVYHPMRFDMWRNPFTAGPDLLPLIWPEKLRQSWPYDQPAVFRSGGGTGRFIVHKAVSEPKKFEFEWNVWE